MFRRQRKRDRPPLPPVTEASGAPDVRIGGRRLGTLGMRWLGLECACGHTGKIAVPQLAERFGFDTRVRDAVAQLRCSQCGRTRILKITLTE